MEFESADEVLKAMTKHGQTIGNRYVEIFSINEIELQNIVRRKQAAVMVHPQLHTHISGTLILLSFQAPKVDGGFIRIRGLPYSCKSEDIDKFFKGTYQCPSADTR